MADFPTSLDSFTNPTATDFLNSPDHATQHINANDAIEALEAKLGIGASTPTSGTVLRGTGVGTSAYGAITNADISTAAWASWTPTVTGYSPAATVTSALYTQLGPIVYAYIAITGTSNAGTLTFTLPVASGITARYIGVAATDNGATSGLPGELNFVASNVCTARINAAAGNWTSSGTKAISGLFFYSI